jgi:hypothetical protein
MEDQTHHWNKAELEIYILLLCANADLVQTREELQLIKERYDEATFQKMYREFSKDSEEESFRKIEMNISYHELSHKEINDIREQMKKVFSSDQKYSLMEHNMGRILNNMLY